MRRIAIAALLVLLPSLAAAQTPRPRPLIDIPNPFDQNKGSPVDQALGGEGNAAKLLAKPFNDLADFISSDALAAAKLAIAIPDLQDGHGQKCWLSMMQFTAVIKAHPIPITLKAMTDIEALRLAAMAANNVCRNPSCTQVFADISNGIQQVSPVPIPIPSLNSLCSKVPIVTVDAPVPMPPEPPATQP